MVAIKAISKSKVSGDNVKLLRREVLNLLQLDHTHIMKLYEVYEDAGNFHLVLELIKVRRPLASATGADAASFG